MNRVAWITLLVVGPVAGFVVGTTVGKNRKPKAVSVAPSTATKDKGSDAERVKALRADLEKYRLELAGRENEVRELREELAEAMNKIPHPLTPEEEQKQKEEKEKQEREERRKALYEKSRELRTKILQRKDRLARALGLEELAGMLQKDNAEETLLGLTTLAGLYGINFDRERFKPYALAALSHEDAEIRQAALACLRTVSPGEDHFAVTLSMADDSSPDIRRSVAWSIAWAAVGERKEEAMPALRRLLQDKDPSVRWQVMQALSNFPDRGEEIVDMGLELSKDPEYAEQMMGWLARRENISAEVAQRLVEMDAERKNGYRDMGWTHRNLADDAKPIAVNFCLETLRDSVEHWQRYEALESLRNIGDVSVLAELEEIARGPDAEGIEGQLMQTIEHLQKRAREAR